MGWWMTDDDNMLGDGPADTLSDALLEAAKRRGAKPTLLEFLNAWLGVLASSASGLIQDATPPITALSARLRSGDVVTSTAPAQAADPLVRILFQASEDIAVEYGEGDEPRKPRSTELLGTAAFILGPASQRFLQIPGGTGVQEIVAQRAGG